MLVISFRGRDGYILTDVQGKGRHQRKRDLGRLSRVQPMANPDDRPADQVVRFCGRAFKIGFVHDGSPFWAKELDA
jgi:hypothetical protein